MTPITATQLHQSLSKVSIGASICSYSMEKCEEITPIINHINQLKAEKNAVILAHSYVSPEIIIGVADHVGDSFELSKVAQSTSADIIIFAAVKFMAETAKILNPTKRVFIPSDVNGCTLSDSITVDTVHQLRNEHPDHAFICYINTSAAVKAACDACVTSSNVYRIVEQYPSDAIYFLPDQLMGMNIQTHLNQTNSKKRLKYYHGKCYVHDEYDSDMVQYLTQKHPDAKIVAHPECHPDIMKHAHFVGSTSQMIRYVKETTYTEYVLLTECGLSSRLQLETTGKQFIGSCTMCRYMKSNQLDTLLQTLTDLTPEREITLSTTIIKNANRSLNAMFTYSQ